MAFTKKKIAPKIFGIIDIGSYKIRVAVCKFHNNELELIGYGEKRQNSNDIIFQESEDLENITSNIAGAIKKAEDDCNKGSSTPISIENIIINIPFEEIFFERSQINYIRENTFAPITKKELYNILKNIEFGACKKQFQHIKDTSGYDKDDIKIIISGVTNILADKKTSTKLIGENPSEINISLLNVFVPETKYEITQFISRALGKNISRIIPSEFAISNLFNKDQAVVIIDIGSSHTSIIVKVHGEILGVRKISVGINSLISQIKENHEKTKNDIINTIDQDIYLEEKQQFLEIFREILVISLEEILETKICPNDFFMIGGGSNKFIKNYLKEINLNEDNLKITGKINFITPKIEYLDNVDSSRSNLNIYAMMMSTLDFIKKENDSIESILKEIAGEI